MSIKFSNHALQQINKRKLSEILASEVAKEPEEILKSYRGRKLRRRRIGDKILEVVTRTEGSQIIIITAYFLEE
jgi:Domain of unknown function (DUF4258)